MTTFMIIIFGLATIRTVMPLGQRKNYKIPSTFIAKLINASMICYCYAYFLTDIVPQLK